MKLRSFLPCILLWALAPVYAQTPPADPSLPHLEKRGLATQLIVDGKPYLALSGELSNTISSNLEFMKTVWPMLADRVHLNTVLTGMCWAWIESCRRESHIDSRTSTRRQISGRQATTCSRSWKARFAGFLGPGPLPSRREIIPAS